MAILLNYDVYNLNCYDDDMATILDTQYMEVNGAIVDELMVRTRTDTGDTNVRETWNNDTVLLAHFQNSLEAGNVYNNGIKITSFKIQRKLSTDLNSIDIGEVTNNGGVTEFYDYTQPNGNLVYTIVPIGENGLDGVPIEMDMASSFSGIWLVDKDTNNVLPFDKAFSLGTADSTLNQTRTILETFSKYAQVYYSENSYETLTLTTIVVPDDGTQSNTKYLDVLNKFFTNHTPKVLKMDNGKIMVVDVGNIKTSTPTATWEGYDYFQLSIDVTEIQDFVSYMEGN